MNRLEIRTLALALGDAAVLTALRPRWQDVVSGLGAPRAWLAHDPDAALAAASGVLLWLAAAWIALGLLAALGARLPGLAGRSCARCARVVVPRVLFRVVVGSTGLGLLAAPAAHAAAPTLQRPATAISQVSAAPAASTWVRTSTWWKDSVPAPTWPVDPDVTRSAILPPPTPPVSVTTRVDPGDSLWLLAARRLGSPASEHDVARYWPQIYAANRDVIGDDPSVIRPGQVLDLPTPGTQESR